MVQPGGVPVGHEAGGDGVEEVHGVHVVPQPEADLFLHEVVELPLVERVVRALVAGHEVGELRRPVHALPHVQEGGVLPDVQRRLREVAVVVVQLQVREDGALSLLRRRGHALLGRAPELFAQLLAGRLVVRFVDDQQHVGLPRGVAQVVVVVQGHARPGPDLVGRPGGRGRGGREEGRGDGGQARLQDGAEARPAAQAQRGAAGGRRRRGRRRRRRGHHRGVGAFR